MIIGGRAVPSSRTLPVIDPATEQVIAQAPDAGLAELDAAVAAARDAFPAWSAQPWSERQAVLTAIARKLGEHQDDACPPADARARQAIGALLQGPGLFFPVTILDNPPEGSRVVQEEPFGRILPLL